MVRIQLQLPGLHTSGMLYFLFEIYHYSTFLTKLFDCAKPQNVNVFTEAYNLKLCTHFSQLVFPENAVSKTKKGEYDNLNICLFNKMQIALQCREER